ncbi:Ap-2 Complex Subunit Alpha-1 [Manis pentadactyla]|nr:Ap-2 Complex Subunit Alpha-1 [Manis pentadactyla]
MNLGACAWNPGALPHDVLHVSLILFGPVSQPSLSPTLSDTGPPEARSGKSFKVHERRSRAGKYGVMVICAGFQDKMSAL